MIDPDTIKIGYGVLVHSQGWVARAIRWFTNSHWNHVAVSLGGYDIVEAGLFGVGLRDLRKYEVPGVDLLLVRVRNATRHEHVKAALFAATKCNLSYDYVQLFALAWSFLFKRPGFVQFVNARRNAYICSEVFYDGWLMTGWVLCPGKDVSLVTPADLDPEKNPRLEEVGGWRRAERKTIDSGSPAP